MQRIFTKKIILTIGIAIVVLSCLFSFFMISDGTSLGPTPMEITQMNASDEVVYWTQQITNKGGTAAYADFVALYSEQPFETQHTHAHVFGEALFKVEGIEGVPVCDSSFGFGCFHSFFGWAMITNGTGITKDLDAACVATYGERGLGCPHGIGHGVMVELGSEKLDEALAICAELNWQKPIGGCTSGVFMEYNQNTMGDGTSRDPKDNWHYPCDAVADRFTQACYFEQTTWWAGLTGADFELIGKRCAEVEESEARAACFYGAGHTSTGVFSFDFAKMRSACSKMPDAEAELQCVVGATWLTSWEPRFQDTWQQMCDGFTDAAHERCLDSKNFI